MAQSTLNLLRTLPPVIERYELKYVIPHTLIEPISSFISAFCELDAHSADTPNGFYPVNSLYFDTINYRFLNLRMWGVDRRFNMRVRSYGDGTVGPYFAEIKFKTPTNIKKFRATLNKQEWPSFLSCSGEEIRQWEVHDKEFTSRALFLQLAHSYAIEPKVFTCYKRRAFFSAVDDYARVTFDIDMRCRAQSSQDTNNPFCLSPSAQCMNYDVSTAYEDEVQYGANVVLELKVLPGAVPVWMIELIRRFELKQVGFSKYLQSSLFRQRENGDHYMDPARACLARQGV